MKDKKINTAIRNMKRLNRIIDVSNQVYEKMFELYLADTANEFDDLKIIIDACSRLSDTAMIKGNEIKKVLRK